MFTDLNDAFKNALGFASDPWFISLRHLMRLLGWRSKRGFIYTLNSFKWSLNWSCSSEIISICSAHIIVFWWKFCSSYPIAKKYNRTYLNRIFFKNCFLQNTLFGLHCLKFTSGTTLADLMEATMADKPQNAWYNRPRSLIRTPCFAIIARNA